MMVFRSAKHAGILLAALIGSTSASAATLPGVLAAPTTQAASATDVVTFSVYLPLRNHEQLESLLSALSDPKSSQYQQWLTPAQFLQQFGPRASDIDAVAAALTSRGFSILAKNAHGVRVSGSASLVSDAFAVAVQARTANGQKHYIGKGVLQLPAELSAVGARVVGLEALPEHHVHSHVVRELPSAIVDNRYGSTGGYWFDDLKQAYDYPEFGFQTDGRGVNVAVLMSDLLFPDVTSGQYLNDVAAVFGHEKYTAITGWPAPKVKTVLVDGGGAVNGGGSLEASLDVQQVLGGAPASNVTLVSIPNLSDQSIVDGYTYIVDSNAFDIVNSSFGECELEYTAADNEGTDYTYLLQQYHEIFAQGNAQGITFVASSGDQGGPACPSPLYGETSASGAFLDPNPTFGPGVSSPADDPDVTSVGGGNLITSYKSGSLNSSYVSENGYADPLLPYDIYGVGQTVSGGYWGAGGGISSIFQKPLYQFFANTGSFRWRTVPDVGMQVGGCPAGTVASDTCANDSYVVVGYGVNYGGGFYGVIGTSVAAPEFVGALALFEQQLGRNHRIGNANYFLYQQGAVQASAGGIYAPPMLQYYHRNIPGNDGYWNGGYPSHNYDYIYGNGSPDVRKLFNLQYTLPAGTPQTPGNP